VLNLVRFLAGLLALGTFLAVPYLAFLALRGWINQRRGELPRWRSLLGFISILSTFLCWLVYVADLLFAILARIDFSFNSWLTVEIFTLALGILAAFALKSPSRAQTLSAGLFLIVLLAASIHF
jgi:hypothetical protein